MAQKRRHEKLGKLHSAAALRAAADERLFLAVANDNTAGIYDAIGDGANVNAVSATNGNTPLHKAIAFGHTESFLALLNCGANVNAPNRRKYTPMHAAVQSGNMLFIDALLALDGDLSAKDIDGQTPLDYAENRIEPGRETRAGEFAEYLATKDSDDQNLNDGENRIEPDQEMIRGGLVEYLQKIADGTARHPTVQDIEFDYERTISINLRNTILQAQAAVANAASRLATLPPTKGLTTHKITGKIKPPPGKDADKGMGNP